MASLVSLLGNEGLARGVINRLRRDGLTIKYARTYDVAAIIKVEAFDASDDVLDGLRGVIADAAYDYCEAHGFDAVCTGFFPGRARPEPDDPA